MEHFQQFRDPQNPNGSCTFGLAVRTIFAIITLVAIILAIIALAKSDKLSKENDAFMVEMQERKVDSYKLNGSGEIEPNDSSKAGNFTQVKRLVQLLIKGKVTNVLQVIQF